ncbi:hypothetical protein LAZ67_2006990 [Cordylochernes scorpioides]|uniref:Uncharacterized protein n=1 Tax=Cordylochernes scorpioides TaxID=51811 RepID=A0ABY6KAA3_9ARAC|nr:hypothetical protein LAZ67_2006990 [Cordylochernes scorpioides]
MGSQRSRSGRGYPYSSKTFWTSALKWMWTGGTPHLSSYRGQDKRRCSGDSTSKRHSHVGSLIAFSLNRKLKKGPLPVKNNVVNLSEEMKFGTAIGKNFLNSSLD